MKNMMLNSGTGEGFEYFAYPAEIQYHWLDAPTESRQALIVVSNALGREDEACEALGLSDDQILVYAQMLSKEHLAEDFDIGLEAVIEIGEKKYWERKEKL